MKPDEPKGWSESMWCIHVWFDGQETTVQVKRELPHQYISRFGSADVFWWGNRFLSLEENVIVHLMLFLHRDTWICTYNVVHLAGGILRNWQQKPELWEKNIAMHLAPSGYSRWCNILFYIEHWESIHRRGGIKTQYMDRIDARFERYERCYKVTCLFLWHSCKIVVTFIMTWVFSMSLFFRPLHHVRNHGMSAYQHILLLWVHIIPIQVGDLFCFFLNA